MAYVDELDYDNAHIIGFDTAGTYQHFKKVETDPSQIIVELVQNHLDSKPYGQPNKIVISINKHPVKDPSGPILEGKDNSNDGIAGDYEKDIYKFIQAVKANSKKVNRPFKIGSKGIGMLQFTNIGKNVIFTSMYDGLIARFALFEKPSKDGPALGAFTQPIIKAATEENKKLFGIYENGTQVSFYGRPSELPWVQVKTVITKLQKEFAMRLIDNLNLEVIVNGERLEAPQEYKDHPPQLLGKTSNGSEIRGAIWGTEEGSGSITFHRGHEILENEPIAPTQCIGYVENWGLEPNTNRTAFIQDGVWNDTWNIVRSIVLKHPHIKSDPNSKRQQQDAQDMATLMLDDMIPKIPVEGGNTNAATKDQNTGDLHGTGTLGYRTKKKPDPDREIKERRKGWKRKKRSEVGENGTDDVTRSTNNKDKRKEERRLTLQPANYGDREPKYRLWRDRTPALLTDNLDNKESPIIMELFNNKKEAKTYNMMFGVLMGEISAETSDEIRMKQSDARVKMWESIGITAEKQKKLQDAIPVSVTTK